MVRLAWRKLVYRKVLLDRYEVEAAGSIAPGAPDELAIRLLRKPDYEVVRGTNPHAHDDDIAYFDRQNSTCIVAFDGDRIAASTWMTQGEVHVDELHRTVSVPPNEHLSCRTYVDPEYRGMALMQRMIHAYSASIPATHLVWGLVYPWNVASVRSLEKIGWRRTGQYWTTFAFGRKLPGERHFPAEPPTTGSE